MKVLELRIFVGAASVIFLFTFFFQWSLLQEISAQNRNATAASQFKHSVTTNRQSYSGSNAGFGVDHSQPGNTLPGRPPASVGRGRCAINFFGLPRAFESLVLPSLMKNVIIPNAAYRCDFFVHYYNMSHEVSGRSGIGGQLNPHEIRSLTDAVHQHTPGRVNVTVEYTVDEEEFFWKKFGVLLKRIHEKKDSHGKYIYYPWKARTYKYPVTVDNIVKMWHSIEQAWYLMEAHATREHIQYQRVAMLRSDVVYMTPINIWETGDPGVMDTENTVVVIPGFGKHPVSDRIVYGPYEAVKQWSTTRFTSLDHHVEWVRKNMPGWGMHSEKFVNITLLPAMRQTGARVAEHATMCFFRARSDESVWIKDCDGDKSTTSRAIHDHLNPDRRKAVEEVLGRKCTGDIVKMTIHFSALGCPRANTTQHG